MLIKDSFPFTHLFLCYQTMENTENYLYTRFSIETNEVFMSHYLLKSFIYAMLNSYNIFELIFCFSPPFSLFVILKLHKFCYIELDQSYFVVTT